MIRQLSYLCFVALTVPLVACIGRSREPETAPSPTVATSSSVPAPPASAVGPMVAFRDEQMTTRVVTGWRPEDQVAKGAGDVFAGANNNGALALFPRPAVFAKLNEFPVDLNAALNRIEALSQKILAARKSEMEAQLASREKKATPGSIVGARSAIAYTYVQLSADRRTMTFSSWWSLETQIDGPLVKAAPAKCLPGQPCAQMADYRNPASVSVTVGARYVLTREGALTEEIVFAPRGDG